MTATYNHRTDGKNSRTTPRMRKRDRIRSAAGQKTLGVAALATIGAVTAGFIGLLGFRKLDADRLKADPNAKPLADEIRDRAASAAVQVRDKATELATDVKDRATEIAGDVRDTTSATVHDLGKRATAIKDEVVDRTRLGDPTPSAGDKVIEHAAKTVTKGADAKAADAA
jgi:hypothetical protein